MDGRSEMPRALSQVIDQHIGNATRKACDARARLGTVFLEARDTTGGKRTIDAAEAALEAAERELSDWQAVKMAIQTAELAIAHTSARQTD